YEWMVNGSAPVTSASTSANLSMPIVISSGSNVCVKAVSSCGNSSTQRCKNISDGKPTTPGNIASNPAASGLCGRNDAEFSVASVLNATGGYTWTVPGGASITSGQGFNSIQADFPGNFTSGNVCVKASNACGNSPQRCVLVKGTPPTPSISGSSTPCTEGENYSANAIGANNYNWTAPAGAIILGQGNPNVLIIFSNNNTGNINVTASNDCGSSG